MFRPKLIVSWEKRLWLILWFFLAVMVATSESAQDKKRAQQVLEIQANDTQ